MAMRPTAVVVAPPDPSKASAAHVFMADRLRWLRATYAGTEGLRYLGEEVLPKYAKERTDSYNRRVKMARLRRNMFRQSVDRITGRIFQVPVKLVEETPRGKELAEDFDRRGNSLDRVARTFYHSALKLGMYHGLVDYPVVNAQNLAQERAAKARPYLVLIEPEDVLRCFEDDKGVITHLAWRSTVVEWDENERAEVVVERIHERFRDTGSVRAVTWRRVVETPSAINTTKARGMKPSQSWILDPQEQARTYKVPGEDPGRIMFHTFYAEREGHMVGRTPLTEVMDLTVEHFQVASDYRGALRQNLFPVLTATGVEQKDIGDIAFTPETVLGSSNPQAKFQMLEHRGSALDSGFKDLESLEQRAEAYAGRLTKPSGDVKATTEALSSAEVSSFAKDMALSLQAMMQEIIKDFATWDGQEKLGEVQINLDFAVDFGDTDMTSLQGMRTNGDISRQTLWREARRRNLLGADFDEDEEQQLIEEEQAEAMKREEDSMRMAHEQAIELTEVKSTRPPPKA